MGIMKRTVLTCLLAAGLAAQQVPDPRLELAKVIAVEDQERDLAKAETLWRDALAGELSWPARAYANRRLGNLLVRLGRDAEAKPFLDAAAASNWAQVDSLAPQDREREATLRARARDLVQQVVDASDTQGKFEGATLYGIEQGVAEQLLWLGDAAVPEVIAALDAMRTAQSYHPGVGASLAAFLWRVGGAKATAFLREALRDERLRILVARSASSLRSPAMHDVVAAYLRADDPDVAAMVLQSTDWGPPLADRLPVALLLDTMQRDAARRQWLLNWCARRPLDDGTLAQLLPSVDAAMQSTDPELGAAAQRLLSSQSAQGVPAMLSLLLQQLPGLIAGGLLPAPTALSKQQARRLGDRQWYGRFDTEAAQQLLPALVACVQKVGPAAPLPQQARQWLEQRMVELTMPSSEDQMPQLLAWVDLGYEPTEAVAAFTTPGNAAEVVARLPLFAGRDCEWLLDALGRIDLPRSLFAPLRDLAVPAGSSSLARAFFLPLARTGDADAANMLLAWWTASCSDHVVQALLALLAKNDAEPVRAALRTLVAKPIPDASRNTVLLALLARNDVPSLDLAARYPMVAGGNPLPSGGPNLTPLTYLLYDGLEPKHSFTDAQIDAVIEAIGTRANEPDSRQPGRRAAWTASLTTDSIPDRRLAMLADHLSSQWTNLANARLVERQFTGPLAGWFEARLRPGSSASLEQLPEPLVDHYRTALLAVLDGDSAYRARGAFGSLFARRRPEPAELQSLLQNRHAEVREAAIRSVVDGAKAAPEAVRPLLRDPSQAIRRSAAMVLGGLVDQPSVPALIELLRDREAPVREAAADALQRIRFYHEQEAHWDRVLHGLDASPATAVEKLLLQAKPDAAHEQRLLAIQSLGTLGVPEALPFLIDWTRDADAAIAAAATAAIHEIHLHPRR